MTDAARTDAFFPHPPEKEWRALTDPELLAAWLMPNDFEPGGGIDTTVTWDLVPEGRGTRLLSQEGFDEDDPRQQAVRRLLGGGWTGHLVRRLEQAITG